MTGPVKIDQVGTIYTSIVDYILCSVFAFQSVSCIMLPIKMSITDSMSLNYHKQLISYDATKLKNMVKFDVLIATWSIFAGPVTYCT